MPTYKFKNTETGEEFEKFMGISARDKYLEENPHLEPMFAGGPTIGDPIRLGLQKVPGGFKEVLQRIHRNTPGSKMDL